MANKVKAPSQMVGPKLPDVNYRRCLCTYVDVLGFRALVKESEQNHEVRQHIKPVLDAFKVHYHSKGVSGDIDSQEPPLVVRHFSDLIIRIVPLSDKRKKDGSVHAVDLMDEVLHEGIDLCYAQFSMLEQGVIVRGGITVGDLYWEDDLVFGPALVRAYDMERGLAHYPRIVVDSDLIDALRQHPISQHPVAPLLLWQNYFRQDFDGVWFVDYLNFYVSTSAPNGIFNREGFREPFEQFYEFISEQLKDHDRINDRRSKYLWLAKYFNSVIELSPRDSGVKWSELKVPL